MESEKKESVIGVQLLMENPNPGLHCFSGKLRKFFFYCNRGPAGTYFLVRNERQ